MDEIEKHGFNHLLDHISIVLYASLKKHVGISYDGLVLDEAHHCLSEKRLEALKGINCEKRILLSATFTDDQKELFRSNFGSLQVGKVSLYRAIEYGFIPKPKIVIHELELDDTEKKHEYKVFGELKSVTEYEKYCGLTGSIEYWKMEHYKTNENWMRFKYLKAASDRKKFLASIKTRYCKELISSLSGKRFICFTGSIEQCDELGSSGAIHSKSKDYLKVIKAFNNEEINEIYAVGMLKEGTNLENIQAGVIIQLSSKLRDFVQMLGRSLRSKETPEQHILYIKNTQDEVYLENVLKEVGNYVSMERNSRDF